VGGVDRVVIQLNPYVSDNSDVDQEIQIVRCNFPTYHTMKVVKEVPIPQCESHKLVVVSTHDS